MAFCLIGLGSNFGDRQAMLDAAVARLGRHVSLRIVRTSPWYETPPVGGPPGQAAFLNGALLLETSLPPQAVLGLLQQIETELGRRPTERWGPRPIDLDLLLYDQWVLDTPSLVVPHPRMAWRRFVLQPAAAVAGSMLHSTTGWTVGRLLEHLDTAAPCVAITGSIGAGKTELAERLARHTGARLLAEPLDLAQLDAFYRNPGGCAWETEIQFLDQRTRLLAADSPTWREPKQLVVSDFWLGQSAAFARAWLAPERYEEFRRRYEAAAERAVRPKLLVVLDVPGEELLRRVLRRGRLCEQGLTAGQLERIRGSILTEAGQPNLGPVLRLGSGNADEVFAEALAAVEGMEYKHH